MATLPNKVNPLTWQVPIVNSDGTPTPEFQRKWGQQLATNASITDLTTAAGVSAILDLIGSVVGSILVRGLTQWGATVPSTAGYVLTDGGPGVKPAWAKPHYIPAGGTVGQVLEKNSGTDYDVSWETPSSGGAASIQDTGSAILVAISSADGQLVLDGSGNPVFSNEVFPNAAIPPPTASALGGVKSLAAVSHNFLTSITTAGLPVAAQPATTDLSDCAQGTWTPVDASGAGLVLTAATGSYQVIGNLVFAWANWHYPVTADGSPAAIGGLPFTCASGLKANTPCEITSNATLTVPPVTQVTAGTKTFGIYSNFTGSQLTNAQFSNSGNNVVIIYPLT